MIIKMISKDLYCTKLNGFWYIWHFDRGFLVPDNKGQPFFSQNAVLLFAKVHKYTRVFQCSHTVMLLSEVESIKSTIDPKIKHK